MENIRRNIKLFFTIYGSLFFQIIGIIVIILFVLNISNSIYREQNDNAITTEKKEVIEKENEDKALITKFVDHCNDKDIEEAYNMLSIECIDNKYQTIEFFKSEYIDKIFNYKKEYKIEKEDEKYKITVLEGILESGSIENRNSIVSYYTIYQNGSQKKIYIEGYEVINEK